MELDEPLTPAQFAARELSGIYVGDVDIEAARAARSAQRECAATGTTTIHANVKFVRVDYNADADFDRAHARLRASNKYYDERIAVVCDEAALAVDAAQAHLRRDDGLLPVVATAWAHRALQMAGARVLVEAGNDDGVPRLVDFAPRADTPPQLRQYARVAKPHYGLDLKATRMILWHRGQRDALLTLPPDAWRELRDCGSALVKLDDGRVVHLTATIYLPPGTESEETPFGGDTPRRVP